MKNKKAIIPLQAIATLIIASLACGGSNTGVKVGETSVASTSAPAAATVYKVGDVVKTGDHTIVLNSAEIQGNKLDANFTIQNNGTTDLNVSSLLSFTAKGSDGTKLEQEFMCGTSSSSLDGKVLPGDKLKGDMCWSGVTTDSVKIYYEPELFASGAIVWEIKK